MTTSTTCYYVTNGQLHDYQTGEALREASATEEAASVEAAKTDGGAGVISYDRLVDLPSLGEVAPAPSLAGVGGSR